MSRFLAAYRTFVEKTTDTPSEFIEASGLMCLGTIATARRWIERGDQIRPNLFMMLIAGSSRDRKSAAVRRAIEMLDDVEPDRLGPSDFTAEALVGHMAVPTKQGIPHKNIQTIGISEFGVYLAQSASYGATSNATLCQLYDGDSFQKIRSGSRGGAPLIVDRPRLSIFAACAFAMFERYADAKDWNTGFYARFLFVPPLTKRPRFEIQPGAATPERDVARAQLTDLRREVVERPGAMAMLPEAEDVFRAYVAGFGFDSVDPAPQASRERLYNTTLKLALLYQIDLNPAHPIGAQAMELACAFGKVCWRGFEVAYGTTAGDDFSRAMRRVWKAISEAGPAGMQRSLLLRNFHLSAKVFDAILRTLTTNGVVELREEATGGKARGRSATKQICVATVEFDEEAAKAIRPPAAIVPELEIEKQELEEKARLN
jgi:hypothetical protein